MSARKWNGSSWLLWSTAGVVLVGVLLWLAAAPVISFVVEKQLRSAGYAAPTVAGASLRFPDVRIERLRLAPGDVFIIEGVRARIGTNGIDSIAAARLRLAARVNANGAIELPGLERTGPGPPPLDLIPEQGLDVAEAEIRLGTPAGEARIALTDVVVRRRAAGADVTAEYVLDYAAAAASLRGTATADLGLDGAVAARLRVADGRIGGAGVRAEGLAGEVVASRMPRGPSGLTARITSSDASLARVALGRLGLEAEWQEGITRFALTSAEESDAVSVSIEGDADLTGGSLSTALSGRILLYGNQGELNVDAELATAADGGSGIGGRVHLTGSGLTVPGVLQQGSLELAGAVDGDTDRLRLTASDQWTLRFTPEAALLPDAMQALAGEELSIGVEPLDGMPLTLDWALTQGSVQLEAVIDAAAGESRLSAETDVLVTWRPGVTVVARALKVAGAELPWGALTLGVDGFEGDARYAADGWRLDGSGELHAAGSLAGAMVEELTARWSGTLSGTSERVVLAARECVDWNVAAIEVGDIRLEGLAPPCIRPRDGDVLLVRDFDEGGTRFAFSTATAPLDAKRIGADGESTISGTWPALEIAGASDADGVASLNVTAADGAFRLPAAAVAIDGVDGSAEIRQGAIAAFSFRAAAIESQAQPAVWAPVGLRASGAAAGDKLSFEASISDPLGTFVLEAAGEYADGRGMSDVTLYPIQFISGATEVADLSPALAARVEDASGTVGFDGRLVWGPDGFAGTGDLSLSALGATVSGSAISGIDGTMRFGALWPPATAPDQRLDIGRLDIGVPLENGIVVYDLDSGGRLGVRRLEFDLAGGRLYAEPFTVDSGGMGDLRLVLRADEVELSQVLVLSRIEGLQGTGVLSGRVPVRMSDRGLELDDGVLAAQTDGVLRYTPADLPEFLRGDDVRSRMLREALTNFHYDELSLSVASEPGEDAEQRLTLNAKGANPDFLEGHPIELNFNFRGPLLGAMRSAVDLSGAGEIEDMFEEQERNDVETTQ